MKNSLHSRMKRSKCLNICAMSEILTESMTRYCYRPSPARFYWIRLWRQETIYVDEDSESVRNEAIRILDARKRFVNDKGEKEKYEMAMTLIQIDRMNAVEVVDEKGDGVVVYKDWP